MIDLKIGIVSQSYSSQRSINGITENDYVKINYYDAHAYIRYLFKMVKTMFGIDLNRYMLTDGYNGFFFDHRVYDIAHFFNGFSLSRNPWVSTFETKLPFLKDKMFLDKTKNWKVIERILKACASDFCKAIIAMSKCSLSLQLGLLSHFPEYEGPVRKKLTHIYPPQKLIVNSLEEKNIDLNGKLKFIFVGREFFRKGGYDVLRCFERLSAKYEFELIVVSGLYNVNRRLFPKDMENETKKLIEKYNGLWLKYYPELKNETVINLMKECHVGLLPTYSDTFGYSVLEFQACGCPVITTDVRALPEINNNQAGWMIDTGKKNNHWEICDIKNTIENHIIENALEKIVAEICECPKNIKAKAEISIERIRKFHSPIAYQKKIENIYHSGVSSEY